MRDNGEQRSSTEGPELVRVIRRLLYSETRYLRWKADGCAPFERSSTSLLSGPPARPPSWTATVIDGRARYGVPRYLGVKESLREQLEDSKRVYEFVVNKEEVKELARGLSEQVPSFDSFSQVVPPPPDPLCMRELSIELFRS